MEIVPPARNQSKAAPSKLITATVIFFDYVNLWILKYRSAWNNHASRLLPLNIGISTFLNLFWSWLLSVFSIFITWIRAVEVSPDCSFSFSLRLLPSTTYFAICCFFPFENIETNSFQVSSDVRCYLSTWLLSRSTLLANELIDSLIVGNFWISDRHPKNSWSIASSRSSILFCAILPNFLSLFYSDTNLIRKVLFNW